MAARWLLNAFSLNLLGSSPAATLHVRRVPVEEARLLASVARSAVGHAETAALFAAALARDVPCARETVALQPGDTVLVGQYSGPRLAPGATSLPEGAGIAWYLVEWPADP